MWSCHKFAASAVRSSSSTGELRDWARGNSRGLPIDRGSPVFRTYLRLQHLLVPTRCIPGSGCSQMSDRNAELRTPSLEDPAEYPSE